ncbi:MAG: adenylate/guanylate cyclase domain-containing protein [Ktedonobacteraceae bacterium]
MPDLPTGTVTLFFTDMEGSTCLLQRLGEHYAAVLADCRHLLRQVFTQYHGHEVDTQGDTFCSDSSRSSATTGHRLVPSSRRAEAPSKK